MIANNGPSLPQLGRALPGWATDAMRFGIPEQEARAPKRVWVMAPADRPERVPERWSESAYLTEITLWDNGLWRQLTTRPGGRRLSRESGYKSLRSAWEAAVTNVNDVGIRTKEEVAADAVELAYKWADRITDGGGQPQRRRGGGAGVRGVRDGNGGGILRVTCPCREVAEVAKTSPMSANRILKRLSERGLLLSTRPVGAAPGMVVGLPSTVSPTPTPWYIRIRGNTPMYQ